jgi:hypothetical protein
MSIVLHGAKERSRRSKCTALSGALGSATGLNTVEAQEKQQFAEWLETHE